MIKEIYVFANLDENGEEAIVGVINKEGDENIFLPLVANTKDMMEKMKLIAIEMAKQDNNKIKLIHFTKRRVVEEFLP